MKVISTLLILFVIVYSVRSQSSTSSFQQAPATNKLYNTASSSQSLVISYKEFIELAQKHGLKKEDISFTQTDGMKIVKASDLTSGTLRYNMSKEDLEKFMDNLAFNNKKADLMKQFYWVEVEKVRSMDEYIALKRAYAKKYWAYLKGELVFSEEYINDEEQNKDNIQLNTAYFRALRKAKGTN